MNPATLREQYVGVAVTVRLQLCSSNNYNRHSISALRSFMYAIHLTHGACSRRKTVILAGRDPKLRHVSSIEFQSTDTQKNRWIENIRVCMLRGALGVCQSAPVIGDI